MHRLFPLVTMVFLCCSPASAHSQFQSVDQWAADMTRRLPFSTEGILTRAAYDEVSRRYVEQISKFHLSLAQKKIEKAAKFGNLELVREIEQRRDQQIEIAKIYAAETAAGVMSTLDPDKKGWVDIGTAISILSQIADKTDFNRNGILEPNEAEIAEAALVHGIDIRNKNAIENLLSELDRDIW